MCIQFAFNITAELANSRVYYWIPVCFSYFQFRFKLQCSKVLLKC